MTDAIHEFTKLNPYPVPPDTHRFVPLLVRLGGIALEGEVLEAIAQHLDRVGFIHLGWIEENHDLRIVVGLPPQDDSDIIAQPGEHFEWPIPGGWQSHIRVIGQLPPGIEIAGDRIAGVCAMPGIWALRIVVGPAIKFDGMGNAGAPLEPGEWIPVDQPPRPVERKVDEVDLSTKTPAELDDIIAQALAAKRDITAEEERRR